MGTLRLNVATDVLGCKNYYTVQERNVVRALLVPFEVVLIDIFVPRYLNTMSGG